jgi:hypothetical protein
MKSQFISRTVPVVSLLAALVPGCGGSAEELSEDPAAAAQTQALEQVKDVQSETNEPGTTGGGGSAGPADLDVTFEDCSKTVRRNEMRDALDDILDHWDEFKDNLEDRGLTSEHDCMHDRLTRNGNVRCDTCDEAGHSSPTGQTANVCRSWAVGIEDRYASSTNSRKVCWASIIMHEFGHTCERLEGGSEAIDDAARETLNDIYNLSLDYDSECNQD